MSAREVLANILCDPQDRRARKDGKPCPVHETEADDIIFALEHEGYVIVPREPTEAMLQAGTMEVPTWDHDANRRKWNTMVAAALHPAKENETK